MNAAVRTANDEALWTITHCQLELMKGQESMMFCTSSRTGPDHLFRLIYELPAGKRGPTEHAHPTEDETLEIVSGKCTFWVNGVRQDCGPGDVCHVPAGARHRMHNPGPDRCVMKVTYTGSVMEDVFVPAGLARAKGASVFSVLARMIVYVVATKPTQPTSKAEVRIMRGIAWLFRLFGVRAQEPVVDWDRASKSAS